MELTQYQVDAFTAEAFGGNPAAVVPLQDWLPDAVMQAVAAENNLAETAFIVPEGDGYRIRWFTPAIEVDLCGHATLASAFILKRFLDPARDSVTFQSASGPLSVDVSSDWLVMDFPSRPPAPWRDQGLIEDALGFPPLEVLKATKAVARLENEAAVAAAAPDLSKVAALPTDGLIITAPGDEVDFVSRYFAPHAGIPEDPVTGSAHSVLIPYWAERLGKDDLTARQISARGGNLRCQLMGNRVKIAGQAVLFMEGKIYLP